MATALGLGARALDLPLTLKEASDGLVPPAVAVHLMGAGGGFLLVFQLFMAVTAAGSAEQIAVSSLIAYDVYRDYINKKATGKQLVLVSRIMVVVYGVISGVLAVILLKLNLSLGWVYLFMGVVIGSAVLPIAFAITWKNCSAAGAISGAVLGQIAGLISWLVSTKMLYGVINLDNTGERAWHAHRLLRACHALASIHLACIHPFHCISPQPRPLALPHAAGKDYPMLTGNIVAICFSGLVCIVVSMLNPQDFDWNLLKEIPTIEEQAEVRAPAGTYACCRCHLPELLRRGRQLKRECSG